MKNGIADSQLEYTRDGMRKLDTFRNAFAAAAAKGVSATDVAKSGQFFKHSDNDTKRYPIRIDVGPDGKAVLNDGTHRYTAAREAGAKAILARVVEYGPRGAVKSDVTAPIKLRSSPAPMRASGAASAAFSGVLKRGVTDGQLDYLRGGMRDMAPFRAAFADAAARGVSATALASSGKYFGAKVQPIQINVYHDGKTTLSDGRHRYSAARAAGAGRILATVTHYGPRGGVKSEKTAVIRLR